MFDFTEEEIKRYSRHIILDNVGGKGQKKLRESRVLIVGAGGLGSPAALYLAAAGIGTLGIIDSDIVEISNLQRQILHSTDDLGEAKVDSAENKLKALNPEIEVKAFNTRLNTDNIENIIADFDLIIDAVDNFATRYLVNDACYLNRKPLIEAGILRFQGQLMTIVPGEGPCYRCIFPSPPKPGTVPSCQEAGVLGAVAGTIGTLQATEALKYLLKIGKPLVGRILAYDALDLTFREVEVDQSLDCPLCGEDPEITDLEEYTLHCEI